MSDTQEFLDDSKSFIEWKLSFVIQMMTEKPESEDYYEYKKKVIDLFSSEIFQHFQQEQEIVTILAESETGVAATNATERAVWKETKPDTFEFSHIEEQKLYTQPEVDRLIREAVVTELEKLYSWTTGIQAMTGPEMRAVLASEINLVPLSKQKEE